MEQQLRLFTTAGTLESDDFLPGAVNIDDTYYYWNGYPKIDGQRSLFLGNLAYNGEDITIERPEQ